MKHSDNRGFTLAELLVVIAIIAVLTAIAIPVFTASKVKAEHTVNLANARGNCSQVTIEAISRGLYTDDGELQIIVVDLTTNPLAKGCKNCVMVMHYNNDNGTPYITVTTDKDGANLTDTIEFSQKAALGYMESGVFNKCDEGCTITVDEDGTPVPTNENHEEYIG